MAPIVPQWELLAGQENRVLFVKEIFPSCHDDMYRGTMALLGEQADETHQISYNFEQNPPIATRWLAEAR
jgi:hypothetical protein